MDRPASITAARWLVGVLAGVVLSFLLATGISLRLEADIEGPVDDIVSNAMPSVQLLATARGDLHQLEIDTIRYADATIEQRSALTSQLTKKQLEIDATIASYLALLFFPGERELFAHARDGLARLDRELLAFQANADADHRASLQQAFEVVDQAIEHVVTFDSEKGRQLGRAIEERRAKSRGMVLLLDAISVALSVCAAILALRQLRRSVRALERDRSVAELRASESSAHADELGQFAGRVAHDVLSPLSTALLSLEIVRKSCEQDPKAYRATDRGVAAIHRVQTLVDGLLTFARAGGRPGPDDATEIAVVIADVVDGLSGQAKDQRIEIVVEPAPPGMVACSAGVLTSLISNLVRNAIRYMGDAVERRIRLGITELDGRWRIEVEDTGPGIPQDQQHRIFEPYVQVGKGKGNEGIGLGLATVDRLVRAHGGTLGVISPPGRGCLFWFELPKRAPVPVPGAPAGQA